MMKKYLAGLALSLMILPAFVSAAPSDIDPDASSSTCVSLSYNLKYRLRDVNTNGEVSLLQDFLQSQGYLSSEPTGYFGSLTLNAAKSFQSANGIEPTGYVGSITRGKISSLTCGTTATTPQSTSSTQSSTTVTLPSGCTSSTKFSPTTGQLCTANTPVAPTAPTISSIQSAGNPIGTIDANHKASIYGSGLSGQLTIKIGNQEPQTVSTVGTSDGYAEFIVPSRTQSAVMSVTVTNATGLTSNFYEVKIVSPTSFLDRTVNTATTFWSWIW